MRGSVAPPRRRLPVRRHPGPDGFPSELFMGPGQPCCGFFLFAPVAGFLLYAWSLSGGGRRGNRSNGFPMAGICRDWLPASLYAALFLNAVVCIRMHESALSYLTGIAAILGTAAAFLFRSRLSAPRPRSRSRKAAGAAVAGAFIAGDALMVLVFIPWSLKGNLPAGWITSPAGRPLRSLLYADLGGFHPKEAPPSPGVGSRERMDLRGVHLEGAVLRRADLRGADFQGASFLQADLRGASFEGANLVDAVDLISDQLLTLKTLYGARLGPDLLKQIQERCPSLLEKPAPGRER